MINSMAIRDFWDFEHYGCWCIEKKGYGPAVDEVDFACLGIYRSSGYIDVGDEF